MGGWNHEHPYAQRCDRDAGRARRRDRRKDHCNRATTEGLAEAHAWLAKDEPLMNAGHSLPSGRVARLVDIVAIIEEEA
jgi:hypothetical protein